jgi:hypothetical protein
LIAPLFKCGIDSATTLVSVKGYSAASSIRIGNIPNVLPALVPP